MAVWRSATCLVLCLQLGCSGGGSAAKSAASAAAPDSAPNAATQAATAMVHASDGGQDAQAADSSPDAAPSGGERAPTAPDAGAVRPPPEHPAAFSRPALCDRADGRSDRARDVFCAQESPLVASLADLDYVLGLRQTNAGGTIYGGAVVLAHSTALSGELVSEINPRAIITTPQLFVAFNRGVQQVELAALDRGPEARFNFYLIECKQACNAAADGCRPGDLYTPRIESDWLSFAVTDDEDLKNSPADCRQCHQRGREKPALLMRELDGPWPHFFGPDQDEPPGFPEATGTTLMRDYLRAKGDEPYASLPSSILRSTVGFTLQNLVTRPQPLVFEGSQILNERWPGHEDGYAKTPEKSPTWYTAYEAFKRGEQLPLPYFDPRVTDKAKLEKLTAAYQRYAKGEMDAAELPDLADIFPDDPQVRAEIGLQTEPKATPAETLIQACGPCHNNVLDQSISRARFNIGLSRMSRAELEALVRDGEVIGR